MFEYLGYSDLDMVKGHPTIAVEMAQTCGMEPLDTVQYYLDNFDTIVKDVSKHYSADETNPLEEADVKQLFNSIIYGGVIKGWKEDTVNVEKHENPKQIKQDVEDLDIIKKFKNEIVQLTILFITIIKVLWKRSPNLTKIHLNMIRKAQLRHIGFKLSKTIYCIK